MENIKDNLIRFLNEHSNYEIHRLKDTPLFESVISELNRLEKLDNDYRELKNDNILLQTEIDDLKDERALLKACIEEKDEIIIDLRNKKTN